MTDLNINGVAATPGGAELHSDKADMATQPHHAQETNSRSTRRQFSLERISEALKNPLGAALLGFILTGVCATTFTKWLDSLSQARDLQVALRNRATDSLRDITNVLYERRERGSLLASTIRRSADLDELKDRKKAYDDVYIKYNSNLQSDIFRISEIATEKLQMDLMHYDSLYIWVPSRFFSIVDACLTKATDIYMSVEGDTKKNANDALSACDIGDGRSAAIRQLNNALQDCIFTYTTLLYRIVRYEGRANGLEQLLTSAKDDINRECTPSLKL